MFALDGGGEVDKNGLGEVAQEQISQAEILEDEATKIEGNLPQEIKSGTREWDLRARAQYLRSEAKRLRDNVKYGRVK